MAREEYPLSDETRQVLTGNVKTIAAEMSKTDGHIYAILRDEIGAHDGFAIFLPMFAAAVRAKLNYHVWTNRIDEVVARYQSPPTVRSEGECFTEKIRAHSETLEEIVKAMADGKFDDSEIVKILNLVERELKSLESIKASLTYKRGLLAGEKK